LDFPSFSPAMRLASIWLFSFVGWLGPLAFFLFFRQRLFFAKILEMQLILVAKIAGRNLIQSSSSGRFN
jgi:hypothetical protein